MPKNKNHKFYLDYAAATPMDKKVLEAMEPFFISEFYNPSSSYLDAINVKDAINKARHSVAMVIGAKPTEIVFTAGGTEANNLAICGIMHRFPDKKVLVSAIEHESVMATSKQFDKDLIKVDEKGIVDPEALKISDDVVLVSVMYANNEIGSVQPIKEIAAVIHKVRKDRARRGVKTPIYLHSDACQATNYLDLHVSQLGIDLMTLNGGKIYGPKQSGCLYIRAGIKLDPLILGGGQEKNLRSGTENVPAIIGFAKSLEIATTIRKDESYRLGNIQKAFLKKLQQQIPEAQINGSLKNRLPNNINFSITGLDGERLVMLLDQNGVQCATGSACSANKDGASHVIKALGKSEEYASSSIRLTLGRQTDETVLAVVDIIEACLKTS